MNREQYISILEIDNAELRKEKEQFIQYLETEIKYYEEKLSLIKGQVLFIEDVFQTKLEILRIILEKVKNGKYDD